MTNLTPGQLDKLPLYVRREIERLDRSVDYWKAKALAGPSDSDTFADESYPDHGRPLGSGPTISFYRQGRTAESSDAWQHRFDVHLQDDDLVVSGGDGILVRPWSSNVVKIRHEERT